MIANLEIRGFLGNLNELYERSSDDAGEWEEFLGTWRSEYRTTPKKTAEVAAELYQDEGKKLRQALPEDLAALVEAKDPNLSRKLGKAFSAREDRRYGAEGLHLRRAGKEQRAVRWTVASTSPEEGRGVSLVSLMRSYNPNAGEEQERNNRATSPTTVESRGETHSGNAQTHSGSRP